MSLCIILPPFLTACDRPKHAIFNGKWTLWHYLKVTDNSREFIFEENGTFWSVRKRRRSCSREIQHRWKCSESKKLTFCEKVGFATVSEFYSGKATTFICQTEIGTVDEEDRFRDSKYLIAIDSPTPFLTWKYDYHFLAHNQASSNIFLKFNLKIYFNLI